MAKRILTNLDLNTNQITNAVAHVLAVEPNNPKEGQVYYDSTLKKLRYYNGVKWVSVDPLESVAFELVGDDIVAEINAQTTTTKISQEKIAGLSELVSEATNTANTNAQNKANDALASAKSYVDEEVARLVGGASTAYDTFKEIEDFLKAHDSELAKYKDIVKKYTTTIGDGVATEHTITHGLNAQDCIVQVQTTNAPYEAVVVDIEKTDANSVLIRTASPVATDELTVVVIG